MTIDNILVSPDGRSPIYLVEFQQGPVAWRYTTNTEEDESYSGKTYIRTIISIEKISQSLTESPGGNGTITLADDDPVVQIFDAFLPVEPVICTILHYEQNDPDQQMRKILSGAVASVVDKENGTSELTIKPLYQSFNRSIPWQVQQVTCGLVLYGLQCGLLSESFKTATESLTTLDNGFVVSPAFDTADPTWFKAGYIKCRRTREVRFVTDQQPGGKLIISYPFDLAKVTDGYDAYAGCMRTGKICAVKFNNKINFMAFERIPQKNMFKSGIK